MLPSVNRIPTGDIRRVMKTGRRLPGYGMILIYVRSKEMKVVPSAPRFSFVVSTKVDKRAVVRNRVRRILSESVHHLLDRIAPATDGIILASKELVGLSQKEAEERISAVFTKAGIL